MTNKKAAKRTTRPKTAPERKNRQSRTASEKLAIALSMMSSDHPGGILNNIWFRLLSVIAVLTILLLIAGQLTASPPTIGTAPAPPDETVAPAPPQGPSAGPGGESEAITPRLSPDESQELISAQGWGSSILELEAAKEDPERLRAVLQSLADQGVAHKDMPSWVDAAGRWPETKGYPKWDISSEGTRTLTATATYPTGWSLAFVVDVQGGDVRDGVFYATQWSLADIMFEP